MSESGSCRVLRANRSPGVRAWADAPTGGRRSTRSRYRVPTVRNGRLTLRLEGWPGERTPDQTRSAGGRCALADPRARAAGGCLLRPARRVRAASVVGRGDAPDAPGVPGGAP